MLVKMKSGRVVNLPEKAAEKLLKIGLCTAAGDDAKAAKPKAAKPKAAKPKAAPKRSPKPKKQQ